MTVAVCIRCGRRKTGAFTACLGCRFTPEQPEDLARSMLLSDQACDPAALEAAGAQLRVGQPVDFDPQDVAAWAALIRANASDLRMPLGCAIVWYAPLAILCVLVLVLMAALAYLTWWTR
jgi:hypothetical protein